MLSRAIYNFSGLRDVVRRKREDGGRFPWGEALLSESRRRLGMIWFCGL